MVLPCTKLQSHEVLLNRKFGNERKANYGMSIANASNTSNASSGTSKGFAWFAQRHHNVDELVWRNHRSLTHIWGCQMCIDSVCKGTMLQLIMYWIFVQYTLPKPHNFATLSRRKKFCNLELFQQKQWLIVEEKSAT